MCIHVFCNDQANPYEDLDDCTVPSTPTLNVPRRGDGFAEAVSSPQVLQRFVFGSGGDHNLPGFPQLDTQTGKTFTFSPMRLRTISL